MTLAALLAKDAQLALLIAVVLLVACCVYSWDEGRRKR